MFQQVAIQMAMLALKPFIEFMVKKAEKKFSGAKQGTTKKDYVLREIDKYLDINPEIKEKLVDTISDDIDDLIEVAVKKI